MPLAALGWFFNTVIAIKSNRVAIPFFAKTPAILAG
jgi:hypothetical protein